MISKKKFQKIILEWFCENGRHDLPWRKTTKPYRILVSEVMLQQTQVERVCLYYKAFLKEFPTTRKLAAASPADVLTVWKGLGYNRRALYLKRAAEMIVTQYKSRFPRSVEEIEKLPGVGRYTARAVSVFAFNAPEVFIETNIRRVYIHFFRNRIRNVDDSDLLTLVEKTLYRKNPRMWYNALMDYGCLAFSDIENPNRRSRHYTKQSRFLGSRRYARAKILDYLLKEHSTTQQELQRYFSTDPPLHQRTEELPSILNDLRAEGFLTQEKGQWSLWK